jgi:hypothetical protein
MRPGKGRFSIRSQGVAIHIQRGSLILPSIFEFFYETVEPAHPDDELMNLKGSVRPKALVQTWIVWRIERLRLNFCKQLPVELLPNPACRDREIG